MKTTYTIFAILLTFNSIAQPGTLDETFHEDGKVVYAHLDFPETYGQHILVQPDGKILVTGSAEGESKVPVGVVLRYLPDGTPDAGFSQDGRMSLVNNGFDTYGRSAALLPDGRIVVLAELNNSLESRAAVHCFHPDGTPDEDFGEQGVVHFSLNSKYLGARAIVVQPDGKIVFGGYRGGAEDDFSTLFIARYHPNGNIDSVFGQQGVFHQLIGNKHASINAIAIQPDLRILATGYSAIGDEENVMVFRLTPTGELDPSFHQDGIVTREFFTGNSYAAGVVVQPDGHVVVAGYVIAGPSNADICVMRYTADGNPDTEFSDDGVQLLAITEYNDRAGGICLQPDGRIVLSGYIHQSGNVTGSGSAVLIRLLENGAPDASFSGDGIAEYGLSQEEEYLAKVTIQPDGKIVAAGEFEVNNTDRLVVLRVNSGLTVSSKEHAFAGPVSIYPNPIRSDFQVAYSLSTDDQIHVNLIDAFGKQVSTLLSPSSRSTGDHIESFSIPGNLPAGQYLVELIGEKNGRSLRRLIVQ